MSFGQQQIDMGYARRPNGTGPFVIQAHTFKANNGNSSPTFEPAGAAASMLAYPNPAQQILHIALSGAAYDTPLTVSDISGKTLRTLAAQPQQDLDVSGWPQGMYFLRWGSVVRKVVVQRQ